VRPAVASVPLGCGDECGSMICGRSSVECDLRRLHVSSRIPEVVSMVCLLKHEVSRRSIVIVDDDRSRGGAASLKMGLRGSHVGLII